MNTSLVKRIHWKTLNYAWFHWYVSVQSFTTGIFSLFKRIITSKKREYTHAPIHYKKWTLTVALLKEQNLACAVLLRFCMASMQAIHFLISNAHLKKISGHVIIHVLAQMNIIYFLDFVVHYVSKYNYLFYTVIRCVCVCVCVCVCCLLYTSRCV